MKKSKIKKRGNKYQKLSRSGVEGAAAVVTDLVDCPACPCCSSRYIITADGKQKISLCANCYFGLEGHKKLGRSKK